MTNDKLESNVDNRPKPQEPEKVDDQVPQNQGITQAPTPRHPVAPGRKPLFRS